MPIFISQGRYTSDAYRAMINKPEDRSEEVAKLVASTGGKMLGMYYTLGEYDFMIISEGPGIEGAVTGALIGAASGTITDLKTTVAMTAADMKKCLANAGSLAAKYRPAGR